MNCRKLVSAEFFARNVAGCAGHILYILIFSLVVIIEEDTAVFYIILFVVVCLSITYVVNCLLYML